MSTITASSVRPPARRTMLLTEARLILREPIGVLWGFVIPVTAFLVLGLIPATVRSRPELHGASYVGVYQNEIVMLSVSMLGLTSLAQIVANYRERGVLRRLSVTPMPPLRLLGAQLTVHAAVATASTVTILAVGQATFGIGPGTAWAAWLLAMGLTIGAMLGLGVLVAAVSPSGRAAGTIGPALFFPLMFFGGLWIPRPMMPALLRTISDWTPLGAANHALLGASDGDVVWSALAVLSGWAVVSVGLAVRLFRWE